MKKTYINPNTMIVNIQTVHMIAASELGKHSDTTVSDNNAVLSRRRRSGVWDDEYDDYDD